MEEKCKEMRVPYRDGTLVCRYYHAEHSNPELVDGAADSLMKLVARCQDRPPGLADGVTIHFGWMRLKLRLEGRELVICEPDFSRDPRVDLLGHVTFTLQLSVMQAVIARLTGLRLQDFGCFDTIRIARGALDAGKLVMMREPGDGGSTWLIWPEEEHFGSLPWEPTPCYKLAIARPHLLKAITLPVGCKAFFDGDEITDVLDPEGESRWPGEDDPRHHPCNESVTDDER